MLCLCACADCLLFFFCVFFSFLFFLLSPAPISPLSQKLERVVDFLLYIKRRPGPALDLPSLYSPEKLQAQEREKAEAAALSSAAVVLSLAAVSASGSPFAALPSPLTAMAAAAASLPKSSAASDLSYAYEPHRSLLQKVRDEALMANFTCNESMMVQLLDANYFEYLENAALGGPEQSVTHARARQAHHTPRKTHSRTGRRKPTLHAPRISVLLTRSFLFLLRAVLRLLHVPCARAAPTCRCFPACCARCSTRTTTWRWCGRCATRSSSTRYNSTASFRRLLRWRRCVEQGGTGCGCG